VAKTYPAIKEIIKRGQDTVFSLFTSDKYNFLITVFLKKEIGYR